MSCKSIAMRICAVALLVALGACGDSRNQADLELGAEIVKHNCKVCHAQGINGAPIIGNRKMWGPRLDKGRPALVANAVNGVGLMPAKGGRSELSEQEIDLAVGYFLSQLPER